MNRLFPRRLLALLVLGIPLTLGASGCKFDGAYDLPLPGGVVSKGESFPITAQFTDALNVVPRTAVMLDDVPVGQVTQIDRKGWLAQVQM
ncbi:MAG TPA: MlaD family protein, partial [Marmoricola sp.]|nr:MlaD family protein [Marmoricola sp.]